MISQTEFFELVKKQLYTLYHNLKLNNPQAKAIFDEYQIAKLSPEINKLQGIKLKLAKTDKQEILNKTGLVHTNMGSEDIYQFKSCLYDINSMLLAWVILFSLDNNWQEDIPVELVKLESFLLDRLKKAIVNNQNSLIIRPVEIESVYSSTALILPKLGFNQLKISNFKENSNMLMRALERSEIFKV